MDKDYKDREVFSSVNVFFDGTRRKLNYTIHNPNTIEETAKVLLDVLMQANMGKVERRLQKSLESMYDNAKQKKVLG